MCAEPRGIPPGGATSPPDPRAGPAGHRLPHGRWLPQGPAVCEGGRRPDSRPGREDLVLAENFSLVVCNPHTVFMY